MVTAICILNIPFFCNNTHTIRERYVSRPLLKSVNENIVILSGVNCMLSFRHQILLEGKMHVGRKLCRIFSIQMLHMHRRIFRTLGGTKYTITSNCWKGFTGSKKKKTKHSEGQRLNWFRCSYGTEMSVTMEESCSLCQISFPRVPSYSQNSCIRFLGIFAWCLLFRIT